MLVSLRWLRDYVDIDLTPAALADRLTMAGLEVDAIREAVPDFTRVVVAKILSIKPHPDAEKLFLCEVTVGTEPCRLSVAPQISILAMSYPWLGSVRPSPVVIPSRAR